ncbi:MarR family winged helix-turn-helix transcriptional regulator [Actinacidiphila acidipaludis]|uniref:MarR family transcriptional regulator n=1 Tax=Actinacidiphila acidipaludis TaxID=2873382 RepID=A0ABS7QF44_9ACTN|nr:MarR family transcriptional regulator [Streptomyces acidipaludis]MBY8881786.1 MarR family transcriptional regulator [Streptomyces acidipaludis]
MNEAMDGIWDDRAAPERLRGLPSRLLGRASGHADRLVGAALAGADARKWHYGVLVALHEGGPASQSSLSTRTAVHRSDLVAVINELAEQGHVERTPDPADRRRNVITLTAQGRRHLRRLDKLVDSAQDALLAPLSPAEREQFAAMLRRVVEHQAAERQASHDDGAPPR